MRPMLPRSDGPIRVGVLHNRKQNADVLIGRLAENLARDLGGRVSYVDAKDHAAIQKFHAEGLKAGGRDNGGAGPRADYSPTYFAAFLIDPDGNNVEAVCT